MLSLLLEKDRNSNCIFGVIYKSGSKNWCWKEKKEIEERSLFIRYTPTCRGTQTKTSPCLQFHIPVWPDGRSKQEKLSIWWQHWSIWNHVCLHIVTLWSEVTFLSFCRRGNCNSSFLIAISVTKVLCLLITEKLRASCFSRAWIGIREMTWHALRNTN